MVTDSELTKTAKRRWEWLATGTAGLTILTFLVLVGAAGAGVITLALPQAWFALFSLAVTGSYAYALGKSYINFRKSQG